MTQIESKIKGVFVEEPNKLIISDGEKDIDIVEELYVIRSENEYLKRKINDLENMLETYMYK